MKAKFLVAMLVLLAMSYFLYEYKKPDKGVITDNYISGSIYNLEGNTVSKASVFLMGSTEKVMSDTFGQYTIKAKKGDELIVSHPNYKKKTVTITEAKTNITLEPIDTESEIVIE